VIRHVVLFRLAEGIAGDDPRVVQAVAAEYRLAELVPEAAGWRFGPSVTHREVCADFAGVGDFDSLDALSRFLAHPAHRQAAGLWSGLATWSVADLDLS
jgi:hypothetical protein